MKKKTIIERIQEKLTGLYGIKAEKISGESSFMRDLGFIREEIESFLIVIESEFEITIPEDRRKNIWTVQQLVNVIAKIV